MIERMDEPRKRRREGEADLVSEDILASRSLADELGIDESDFAPDELAPPVNEARLRKLVGGSLPPVERDELRQLIASFRTWRDAWRRMLSESR